MIKDWKKEILTVPNLLSIIRLLMIPVYMVIYLNADSSTDYYIAGAILAISCLTDLIDGKIARHFNLITNLGKLLDPVADKATQFTLIVCLASRYHVLFKETVGMSPRAYITMLRMRHACDLLNNTNLTVKQIGALVGYEDSHFFCKTFKSKIGVSPSLYRKDRKSTVK